MKKVLVVVDFQNDFVTGPLGTLEAQAIIENVRKKVKEYRDEDFDVFFTMDTHAEYYLNTPEGLRLPVKHCIYGTKGHEKVDGIDPIRAYTFGYDYLKHSFGCDELVKDLLNDHNNEYEIDQIELIGVCTDICVITNALMIKNAFWDKFTKIVVDASCCAGTTPEKHRAALEVMRSCQIEVINE